MEHETRIPEQQAVPLKNETWRLSCQHFLNIIIATVICMIIVLSLSMLMVGSIWGKILVELICLFVSLSMIYGYMWAMGDRDANFVQFGRMKKDILKGFRAGFFGTIPVFLLNIPLALSMKGIIPFDFMPAYRMLSAPMWGFINMLHPDGGAIPHAGMPAQPATDLVPAIEAIPPTEGLGWGAFAVFCLLPIFYIIFSGLGYYFGTKRFSLVNKLVYKDDPEKIAAHLQKKRRRR